MMLCWNVYRHSINTDAIEPFNVFNHSGFSNDCKKAVKKYKTKEAFADAIRSSMMYYYWSKYEWEVIVSPFSTNRDNEIKVDVYSQVKMNWDRFIDYLWDNKKEISSLGE